MACSFHITKPVHYHCHHELFVVFGLFPKPVMKFFSEILLHIFLQIGLAIKKEFLVLQDRKE